jgi:hypothetical protein
MESTGEGTRQIMLQLEGKLESDQSHLFPPELVEALDTHTPLLHCSSTRKGFICSFLSEVDRASGAAWLATHAPVRAA